MTDPSPAAHDPGVTRSVLVMVVATTLALGLGGLLGGATLLTLAAAAVGLQWLAFVPAFALRTERFYDLTGSLTYVGLVTMALATADSVSLRGAVLAGCVLVWAVRLGSFLAWRVHRAGRDSRFDTLKQSAHRFAMAWTLQGLWVFLTPLAVWLVILRPVAGFGLLDIVGIALWACGFAIEVTADTQKVRFRADPANAGRFITTGTWAWSRHPNYFGEILLWSGVFLAAASQLHGVEWLAVVSPLFVTLLLVKGSGIPLLEAQADARWGEDPAYRDYKSRTPVLIPWPPGSAGRG